MINVNIGLMGHVDSGKTSIAKCLSSIAGTACFDKSPQSQSRGITLDLGFSTYSFNQKQVTIVDCPGHASLIRTVLCGSQIIDSIVLVIDASKGIQAQTAECLIVAEIMTNRLIVVVNKIDLLQENHEKIEAFKRKLSKILENGKFGRSPIVSFSAVNNFGVEELKLEIDKLITIDPIIRNISDSFVFAVDHCFPIKGQGTILTGTVLQGQISINEMIQVPELKQFRKIKSIQSFRESVKTISAGDRAGICVQSLDSNSIERTLITSYSDSVSSFSDGNSLKKTCKFLLKASRVKYFKGDLKSKGKIHISILNELVLCKKFTIVKPCGDRGFEFVSALSEDASYNDNTCDFHVLIELERPINYLNGSIVIGSKLDTDPLLQKCRIAFHGRFDEQLNNLFKDEDSFKVFKVKERVGSVDRIVSEYRLIGKNFASSDHANSSHTTKPKGTIQSILKYIGMSVTLHDIVDPSVVINSGVIESLFGSSGKFNVQFREPLKMITTHQNIILKLQYKKEI